MVNIGKRIKSIREELGLKQLQFAKELGLESATVISRYENGQRQPEVSVLVKISELADKDLVWLITGEEPTLCAADKKLLDLFHALPEDSKLGLVGMLSNYVSPLKDDEVQKAYESFKKSFMKEVQKKK